MANQLYTSQHQGSQAVQDEELLPLLGGDSSTGSSVGPSSVEPTFDAAASGAIVRIQCSAPFISRDFLLARDIGGTGRGLVPRELSGVPKGLRSARWPPLTDTLLPRFPANFYASLLTRPGPTLRSSSPPRAATASSPSEILGGATTFSTKDQS